MDDDGANSAFGNFPSITSTMDLDFMEQLFDEGCWMGTPDGFTFPQQQYPPSSNDLYPASRFFPSLDPFTAQQKIHQEADFHDDSTAKGGQPVEMDSKNGCSVASVTYVAGYESHSSIKDRLEYAIKKLKEYTEHRDVLVQIWVPIYHGGKHVLTTEDQPYFLTPKCMNLVSYRDVSKGYHFEAEADSKEFVGLPGRVFLGKLPEWTPDVRYFKTEEYPRRNYAAQLSISGSLAFPVFERNCGSCLGVVEVITTTRDIKYRPELENVCKALEAVDLSSSNNFVPPTPSVTGCKEFCQAAVPELQDILASVCSTHKLPLALTWAPCFRQGKGGCRHFDESYACYISTVDSACHVTDTELHEFHAACSEQYLFLGQGIVGKAFTVNKQCFANDVTAFSKSTYPLSHQAMVFGLNAAVAIPLQSQIGGPADFVLEFFLPKDCQERKKLRDLLPLTVQQASRSLRVVMEKEVEEEMDPRASVPEESSWISRFMEAQGEGDTFSFSMECAKEEPQEEFKVMKYWETNQKEMNARPVSTEHQSSSSIRRTSEKRRTKTEKTVSLEVLRQYFAGSLKDAAKSLGVCPTTLKRICRQYGINRWPSRKIKKVGHTLKKLQLVIDSVQGAEGSIKIGSFYTAFPDLTSPKENNCSQQPESSMLNNVTAAAIASKSASTSSSQSSGCSSCQQDALSPTEDPSSLLKRTHSDAELLVLNHHEELKQHHLRRSQSHRTLNGCPKRGCRRLREGNGFRVKASFGEDTIRFSLPSSWGFVELQQELLSRFNVDTTCRIDLKYLDDDHEWVLLTCDADLEECKDVYMSEQRHTIKLSVHRSTLRAAATSSIQQ
ncbi:unnamed protein product [Linum tenue]|uniref:Uncharacterized protein n=1 Tax=Linum tenue TaxID=586396 RepID=A0AAV0PEF1_9ROSI|nr:unnamed protein product [Linum tenue]